MEWQNKLVWLWKVETRDSELMEKKIRDRQ